MKSAEWLLVGLLTLPVQATQHYRLDASNTDVAFAVHYLGIQWVTARFSDISGEFIVDPSGSANRVDVSVGIASLSCNEPRWNERLRSPEWLDVERYPRMIYHSVNIELSDQRGIANGELTLHGITRPIVLDVTSLKCPTSQSCEFAAHGRIKRSDYGLPHGFWTGGDQVDIDISGTLGSAGNPMANQ